MPERFNVEECKTCPTLMEDRVKVKGTDAMQFLIYISEISRPEITFITSYLSRFLDHPTCSVWNAAKRILCFLKGTMDSNLIYEKLPGEYDKVIVYADADWGGDRTDCKSMSGMASCHCGNLGSWGSKKQQA
ncbi:hypothetical protein PR048_023518 [Dryococelus australis]|uniref:Polyprotein n=1 Tax=Dryococelus australis TaxID=614101 RepID=A0ABQ9GUC4_9NEOP|nr:hypothetical protein PR048_023518 [Dryococelus australis]